ncbi:MAG: Dam family site-specific DNA-(adenine-N6)-methyltransferase, partial [Firmicutes bacterium]|nr:Dam family site-specific DNA-(adenine-N6)-methyltransferase [Bacillota bacterium]
KNPNIVNEPVLRAVSRYLNRAEVRITCGDFEASLENIKEGSFVYLDPPYDPLSDSANFTEYDKGGFDRSEQLRLKKTCDRLDKLGVKFLLSNSATEFIKDLYRDYKCEIIPARRSINANGRRRGEVEEILVRNYA